MFDWKSKKHLLTLVPIFVWAAEGCSVEDDSTLGPLQRATRSVTAGDPTNDASIGNDNSPSPSSTGDAGVHFICPPAPPVDLNTIPELNRSCTRLVYAAGVWPDNALAVSVDDANHWQRAFGDPVPSPTGFVKQVTTIAFGLGFGFALGADAVGTPNGAQWDVTDAAPPPPYYPNSWQTLGFVNNMFVYMGQNDGSGYSSDGVSWQHVAHGDSYSTGAKATFPAAQFAYGNGIYIAVGSSRASGPQVAAYRTSTDGQNWSDDIPLGSDLLGWVSSVAFGNGQFVVVGGNGGDAASGSAEGLIAWSSDAKTWTIHTNENPGPLGPMHFSQVARSDTLFVASSIPDFGGGQWLSEDGVNWRASASAPSVGRLMAFENHFIGGPVKDQPGGIVVVSDDGMNWTQQVAFTDPSVSILSVGVGRVLKVPQ